MPDALVKPEARERERERASGGAGEGETKRGGSGRDDFLQTLHPPLSYSHSPTPTLPRSLALSLSPSPTFPLPALICAYHVRAVRFFPFSPDLCLFLCHRRLRWRGRTRCVRARAFVISPHAPTSR